MGQLDDNKGAIVAAIENTNRLAVEIRDRTTPSSSALDDIPDALRSVNRQRDDLVKLLEALTRLSGVGTRVIRASKESTINSLRSLGPVLEGFAEAGQDFPKSLQVFLTYPFVDEAVGRDPQVARNLHMGDYTNLSVDLDVSLTDLRAAHRPLRAIPVPPEICAAVNACARPGRPGASTGCRRLTFRAEQEPEDRRARADRGSCGVTVNTVRQYIAAALLALGDLVTGRSATRLRTTPSVGCWTTPPSCLLSPFRRPLTARGSGAR